MGLLDGKTAIVTGAGRGVGAAHARALSREGANVVINDIGQSDDGEQTAELVARELREAGGQAVAHTGDISTMVGGRSLLDCALDSFGSANILVNNAGILRDKSFLKLTEEDWDQVIRVNLKGFFAVTQPVFGWMKDNGGGVIVNTTSTSGLVGNLGQANYAASKAGVFGLSNTLAIEGQRFGIRVWTLAPTATSVLTAPYMTEQQKLELDPKHVSEALLYMVSDLSGDRTGTCLFASGYGIRELRVIEAEGIDGPGKDNACDARAIARSEDRLFRPEPKLTIVDFGTR